MTEEEKYIIYVCMDSELTTEEDQIWKPKDGKILSHRAAQKRMSEFIRGVISWNEKANGQENKMKKEGNRINSINWRFKLVKYVPKVEDKPEEKKEETKNTLGYVRGDLL